MNGKLFILSLLVVFGLQVNAQDIHFAQFYNAPQLLNPALTGIFNGDLRFSGHYRRQWENVPVDYMTFSGNFDTKLYTKNTDSNNFWGLGLNFNYDRAGFSELRLGQFQLGGSYSAELATNTFLTGGLQLGLTQRRFSTEDLTFDSQFNGERFDPTLPSNELFADESIFFVSLSAGANLRLQNKNQRSKLDFGFGIYHINQPDQNFSTIQGVNLPLRFSLHALGAIKLIDALDLIANGTAQFQGPFNENVLGLGLRIYLNRDRGKELAFQLGGNIRLNDVTDAVIPTAELHFNTLSVGFSYDVNVSDFDIATDQKGGPEIWVSYRIAKVKPLRTKICPIF